MDRVQWFSRNSSAAAAANVAYLTLVHLELAHAEDEGQRNANFAILSDDL